MEKHSTWKESLQRHKIHPSSYHDSFLFIRIRNSYEKNFSIHYLFQNVSWYNNSDKMKIPFSNPFCHKKEDLLQPQLFYLKKYYKKWIHLTQKSYPSFPFHYKDFKYFSKIFRFTFHLSFKLLVCYWFPNLYLVLEGIYLLMNYKKYLGYILK